MTTHTWGLPMNPASRLFPAQPALHTLPDIRRQPTTPPPPAHALEPVYEGGKLVGHWGRIFNRAGTKRIRVWIPEGDVA